MNLRSDRTWQLLIVLLSWFVTVLAHAAASTPFGPAPDSQLVLYRGATLIDGTEAPARADMNVLVEGERITRVFPDSTLDSTTANKARIVDLRGRYLLPGLIDSHVHLATPPNRRQAEAILRRDVYGGVTAVRDMADDLRAVGDIARASLVGEIAGPDVYYAALMAGPDFFTDRRTVLVSAGGTPGQVPWLQAITEQSDIPSAVALARGTYATAIKLYADLTPDLAARITSEAHRQHILVWAHATLYPAKPSEVVAAGVDVISHACLLIRESAAPAPRFTEPRAKVSLDAFTNGQNPALARLFSDMIRRETILDATVWTYGSTAPTSATTPPLQPGACDDRVGGAITGQAYRAGVSIAAGTDSIAPAKDPWPDLFHELAALVAHAGMPASAVLHSATLINARATGQERDMGSIEAGKLANMVVLTRNPMDSIDNLASVVMTVKRGRVYKRSDFRRLRNGDITDF